MSLNAVLRFDIPDLDERIFACSEEEACSVIMSCWNAINNIVILFAIDRSILKSTRLKELQRGNLILMSPQLEQPYFANQVPDNDICILRSARKAYALFVERKNGDCRSVAIEGNDDCC